MCVELLAAVLLLKSRNHLRTGMAAGRTAAHTTISFSLPEISLPSRSDTALEPEGADV